MQHQDPARHLFERALWMDAYALTGKRVYSPIHPHSWATQPRTHLYTYALRATRSVHIKRERERTCICGRCARLHARENRDTTWLDAIRCDTMRHDTMRPYQPYMQARRTKPERARKHVTRARPGHRYVTSAQTLNVLSLYALSRLVPVTREDKVARGTTFLSNSLRILLPYPLVSRVRETVFPAGCDAIGHRTKQLRVNLSLLMAVERADSTSPTMFLC